MEQDLLISPFSALDGIPELSLRVRSWCAWFDDYSFVVLCSFWAFDGDLTIQNLFAIDLVFLQCTVWLVRDILARPFLGKCLWENDLFKLFLGIDCCGCQGVVLIHLTSNVAHKASISFEQNSFSLSLRIPSGILKIQNQCSKITFATVVVSLSVVG